MQINTERLILRDHLPEDWADIHEYAKDPDFSKYDVWGPNSEEDTKKFVSGKIEQAKADPRYKFDLAVIEKQSGKVIGGVGVRRSAETSSVGNLGYSIHPLFQQRGLASEAVGALLEFGFKTLGEISETHGV